MWFCGCKQAPIVAFESHLPSFTTFLLFVFWVGRFIFVNCCWEDQCCEIWRLPFSVCFPCSRNFTYSKFVSIASLKSYHPPSSSSSFHSPCWMRKKSVVLCSVMFHCRFLSLSKFIIFSLFIVITRGFTLRGSFRFFGWFIEYFFLVLKKRSFHWEKWKLYTRAYKKKGSNKKEPAKRKGSNPKE